MPYSGPSDRTLPEHVRKLPAQQRRRWINVFNSVYDRTHDDGAAMRAANGAVKGQNSAIRAAVDVIEVKALTDVVDDDDWWEAQRKAFLKIVEPIFLEIFLAGAEAAAMVKPVAEKVAEPAPRYLNVNPDALNDVARQRINNFINIWWAQAGATIRNELRGAILGAMQDGSGVEGVLKKIEPLFGPERARKIAVTETTRLFGEGAQATYRLAGLDAWEWQTVRDLAVDSECAERQGQQFPQSVDFAPAHVQCRCFPKPVVGKDEAPTSAIPYPDKGFASAYEANKWMAGKYPDIKWRIGAGLDTNAVNIVTRELDELLTKYPKGRDWLDQVGVMDRFDFISYGLEQAYAAVVPHERRMIFNPNSFGLSAVAKKKTTDDLAFKFHPAINKDPMAQLVIHEFGHVVEAAYGDRLRAIAAKIWGSNPSTISIYAGSSPVEAFAEAFSMVGSKSKLAIIKELEKVLNGLD